MVRKSLLDDPCVLALRALRPGVKGGLREGDRLRQRDARLGDIDAEGPPRSGGIPVEFVEGLEEADLACGPVADDIGMRARGQQPFGAADADAHAVGQTLSAVGLVAAVAADGQHIEADGDATAVARGVDGREVAQDAAADFPSLRLHADGLGHAQVAVTLHLRIADEVKDALDRLRRRRRSGEEDGREGGANKRDHAGGLSKATCGAARSPSSISKNSASENPSGRAISTLGKDWIAMLRLRTLPL